MNGARVAPPAFALVAEATALPRIAREESRALVIL
jgi:hypothetical protein